MSSDYQAICLSHNPAFVIPEPEWRSSGDALNAVTAYGRPLLPGHTKCDLLVGRYSGSLVELACPPREYVAGVPGCVHGGVEWISARWLKLALAALNHMPDHEATSAVLYGCWSKARVLSLRDVLEGRY